MSYDLEISPDRNTAVLTTRLQRPLMMGVEDENETSGTIQVARN